MLDTWIDHARALRETLLRDPHRPRYHYVAPEGICAPFDPNGAIFWNGRYHLMTIVQTRSEEGGVRHFWAHASSADLVHWRQHPLALAPGGVDEGIFSGGASLDPHGTPTITYWGLGERSGICLATSTDPDLDTWEKSPANPIIHQTASGLRVDEEGRVMGAADPSAIWVHEGRAFLLTGNLLVLREYGLKLDQDRHKGDTAYLFVSDDLIHWEYLHPFYTSNRAWTRVDEDCMCPDFFPLGERHMLLFISHNLGCQYYLGRYEDNRFYPETHGRMTWVDNAFFAPESLLDDKGRRIMWAWIFDGRGPESRDASGWSGTLSLPRVLWLGEEGTLQMAPPEELASLRTDLRSFDDLRVADGADLPLLGVQGTGLELEIEILPGDAARVGVEVCRAEGGEETTAIFYDAREQALKVDTTRSSLGEGPKSVESAPFALAAGEPLRLRVFVDRSVVEVFANDRQAVMRRIYPTRSDSTGVRLFSRGGDAIVGRVNAWTMAPANPW